MTAASPLPPGGVGGGLPQQAGIHNPQPAAPPINWFYSNSIVSMAGDGAPYAYKLDRKSTPRPGNIEDEIVADFIKNTSQPEFASENIECHLRIALRRAADAAVRTTLDAEAEQGVVYQTAEERAAAELGAKDAKEVLRHLNEFGLKVMVAARDFQKAISGEAVQP